MNTLIVLSIALAFCCGAVFGMWARDSRWREKGEHEYMNRMASGGRLYIVRRDKSVE